MFRERKPFCAGMRNERLREVDVPWRGKVMEKEIIEICQSALFAIGLAMFVLGVALMSFSYKLWSLINP